jgi:uncharacterized protein (TIGR03067 family)
MRTLTLTVLFLSLAVVCRADDADPEPPGGSAVLRKLQGEWQSVRRVFNGKETTYPNATYTFEKDKVTYTLGKGKGKPREMKLKPDSKRPDAFALEQGNAKTSAPHYFFKIEKGELYLMPVTFASKKGNKPDFSGNAAPVIVFKKAK